MGDNRPPRWLVEDLDDAVRGFIRDGRTPVEAVQLVVSALAFVAGGVMRDVVGETASRALDASSWGGLVASLAGDLIGPRARRRR